MAGRLRPLSRTGSRAFVLGLLALMLGLAALATVLITRGWADPQMQARVRQMEAERAPRAPDLTPER